jgi:hypothetical protein
MRAGKRSFTARSKLNECSSTVIYAANLSDSVALTFPFNQLDDFTKLFDISFEPVDGVEGDFPQH